MDSKPEKIGVKANKKLPMCPYGVKCYRKNPTHFEEYDHPNKKQTKTLSPLVPSSSKMTSKTSSDTTPFKNKRKIDETDSNSLKKFSKSDDDNSFMNQKETNQIDSKITEPKLSSVEFNNLIQKIFLVKMPNDFFQFWEFCKKISPNNPQNALVDSLGFKLVGPFDVLSGVVNEENANDDDKILAHWRFYYDPPEFQTFAVVEPDSLPSIKLEKCYHLGYFRDEPDDNQPVVVSNDPEKSCIISGVADNIFAAIYIELVKSKSMGNSNDRLDYLEEQLKSFAASFKIDIKAKDKLNKRKKKVNAPTFNKFGIVVEVVKDVGYRELPQSDKNLKSTLDKIASLDDDEERRKSKLMSDIHQTMNLINYANDEKDFGMALEFGIDLFCYGHPFFHRAAKHLLCQAYGLLNRNDFGRIINQHLDNRRQGYELSMVE